MYTLVISSYWYIMHIVLLLLGVKPSIFFRLLVFVHHLHLPWKQEASLRTSRTEDTAGVASQLCWVGTSGTGAGEEPHIGQLLLLLRLVGEQPCVGDGDLLPCRNLLLGEDLHAATRLNNMAGIVGARV